MVTINSTTIPAGGTGSVDVLISSTNNDLLNEFNSSFLLTTGGATQLAFVDPQSDSQLTNPNYVFFGNSFSLINAVPVGNVATTNTTNDSFFGGDSTNNQNNVMLSGTNQLLFTFSFTTATAAPPVPGDTFTLSLEPPANANPGGGDDFFFINVVGQTTQFVPYSSTAGTITISGAVLAVPEPASWALFGLGLLGLVARGRRAGALVASS